MESLDPRINRLKNKGEWDNEILKSGLDQLETYEVFLRLKDNRPFEHVGVMHASNEEMALILAKEQFSRRYTCTGLFVARTDHIMVTDLTEDNQNIYDQIENVPASGSDISFEIFHLKKRGKQHVHMGSVEAGSYENALSKAKETMNEGGAVFNVWVIRTKDIVSTSDEDQDIWDTLPEKIFREAIAYKAGDKIKEFKERK